MSLIFDLDNLPINCYVGLDDAFRERIFTSARTKFGGPARLSKQLGIRIRDLYKYENGEHSIPWNKVRTLMELCKGTELEFRKNIVYLKLTGKSFRITGLCLPIRFSPDMAKIAGHIVGDGGLFNYRNGLTTVGHYTNKEKILIETFKAALIRVFGNVLIYEFYDKRHDAIRLTIPSKIGVILKYFFGDQNGLKKHIPEIVLQSNMPCKALFLRAIFDDEGNVNVGGHDGGGKSIEFTSECSNVAFGAQKMLSELGIESHVHKKGDITDCL